MFNDVPELKDAVFTNRDPFASSVSVEERSRAMRTFKIRDYVDALNHTPCLQPTTRKVLEARLRKYRRIATVFKSEWDQALCDAIDAALASSEPTQSTP